MNVTTAADIRLTYCQLLQQTLRRALDALPATQGVTVNGEAVRQNCLYGALLWRVRLTVPHARPQDTRDYDILIVPRGTRVSVEGVPLGEHFNLS
jgi:hypothetical protein